jgi:hypothetical protein
MANNTVVRCNNCKAVLDEAPDIQPSKRTPCPSCGSISRCYEIEVHAKINVRASVGMKAKRGGRGKPFIEQQSKHELYRKSGQETDVTRIIDRENNLYKEIIKDYKTGEIIKECTEPLDKHVGHGTAKPRVAKERKAT